MFGGATMGEGSSVNPTSTGGSSKAAATTSTGGKSVTFGAKSSWSDAVPWVVVGLAAVAFMRRR